MISASTALSWALNGDDWFCTEEEEERLAALLKRGILISPQVCGCKITHRPPLEEMKFELNLDSDGGLVRTSLHDTTKNMSYMFENGWMSFRGNVGDVEVQWGDKKNWDRLNKAGVLPLSHLSPKTLKILDDNTCPMFDSFLSHKNCLYIVEAIMKDPPRQYRDDNDSTNWIVKVHREKAGKMRNEMEKLRREDEKKAGYYY
ncbi:hypothetical protein FOZ60_015600 [Perkinsus olseni]|uniref:Uncharacterized protein n=1 Tax=Perkinsus olseni TaxID=32597 RepID=A0A7J6N5J4_PEROL|nr:hypothetical protein FOZ60_015600 [Perkinsus olseni]